MIKCIDCNKWEREKQGKTQDGRAPCLWLSSWKYKQWTRPDFGCVDGEERKAQGPFSVVSTRDAERGLNYWYVKRGERQSPQFRTQNEAQQVCDFMNYEWSITGIDNVDICQLYRTVGSRMWLDAFSLKELNTIARDILPVLLAHLRANGCDCRGES